MGYALVTVVKTYDGKEFANTHGIRVNADDTGPIDTGELAAAGGGAIFNDATTDPGDVNYLGESYILHAIIGYERSMLYEQVQFVRLEVSDGAPNDTGATTFLSQTLNFTGLRTGAGGDDNLAPGNVTLLVNKEPATFSSRRGRHYFRGALLDLHVRLGGATLLRFTDDDVIDFFAGLINGAVSSSRINTYFAAGPMAGDQLYAIPRYGPKGSPTENYLVGTTPMSRFTVVRPAGRQVTRGRRELGAAALARSAARPGNEAKAARLLEAARLLQAAKNDAA